MPFGKKAPADPYWDSFINKPPADSRNQVNNAVLEAAEGSVFPVKSDVHSPDVMSSHIKQLARFFGADLTGIARLPKGSEYPFGIVCVVRAEYDPRQARGIGGQAALQNGLFLTFNVGAIIREMGFRATAKIPTDGDRLAAVCGLGTLDANGRLVTRHFGAKVYVADVVYTDLPLAPDGVAP